MTATRMLTSVGWLCIRRRRLLTVRTAGRDAFYLPGGKIEPGESHEQALVREVREELGMALDPALLRPVMVVSAPAHGLADTRLHMHCYAGPGSGDPQPNREIEEMAWIGPHDTRGCAPAVSQVLRELTRRGLWD